MLTQKTNLDMRFHASSNNDVQFSLSLAMFNGHQNGRLSKTFWGNTFGRRSQRNNFDWSFMHWDKIRIFILKTNSLNFSHKVKKSDCRCHSVISMPLPVRITMCNLVCYFPCNGHILEIYRLIPRELNTYMKLQKWEFLERETGLKG